MTLAARGAEQQREGGCPKVPFASHNEAEHQARIYASHGRPRLRVYRCRWCVHWHLTRETEAQARERAITGRSAQHDDYHRDYYRRRSSNNIAGEAT
jgi:hypothetical protein